VETSSSAHPISAVADNRNQAPSSDDSSLLSIAFTTYGANDSLFGVLGCLLLLCPACGFRSCHGGYVMVSGQCDDVVRGTESKITVVDYPNYTGGYKF
jgi:hypothetical protein